MSPLESLVSALREAMTENADVLDAIATGQSRMDDVMASKQRTTHGTSDPLPEKAIAYLQQAKAALSNAAAAACRGDTAIEYYITVVLGVPDGTGSATSTEPETSSTPAESTRSKIPPFRSERAKAEEIVPFVDARNHNGRALAFGRLYDENGTALGRMYTATDFGPAHERAHDMTEPWRSSSRLLRHVEGHAAARMRKDRRKTAVLYLNLKPCGYPNGCHRNLEAMLPQGYTLYVHQVWRRGSTRIRRYHGTGKALTNPEDYQ